MGNWETLGKHARAMNVSGKMLPRFADVFLNRPALTSLSSVPGSRVTLPDTFRL